MNFGSFLSGAVVGGVLVFGTLSYHVLRTDDGVQIVPKAVPTFYETYVDIREFNVSDWARHKTLVAAIVKAKKEQLFGGAAVGTVTENFEGLFQKLNESRNGS